MLEMLMMKIYQRLKFYTVLLPVHLKKISNLSFMVKDIFHLKLSVPRGLVNFYAAVPVALVDVVKQAVVSAYPTARLEEVSESNIFSPIGKISGTIGGEMNLKRNLLLTL